MPQHTPPSRSVVLAPENAERRWYILCTTCGTRNTTPSNLPNGIPAQMPGWHCGHCYATTLIRVPEPPPPLSPPPTALDPRSSVVVLGTSGAAIGAAAGGPAGAVIGAFLGGLIGALLTSSRAPRNHDHGEKS